MITLLAGDCRDVLATLPAQSVQTIVTSPPYYGLRKYTDDPREIGQEPTPAAYVAALVAVFAACWRVLRDDGVLWLNLGDSYASSGIYDATAFERMGAYQAANGDRWSATSTSGGKGRANSGGIATKNLLGIPWRVAFALQDAGWILRSDIIWSKPNPMPESVRDRPTRAHEYLFLFAKQQRYFYDATAIAEPVKPETKAWAEKYTLTKNVKLDASRNDHGKLTYFSPESGTRNRRTVWTIATQPYSGAHFATMPEVLIAPCILAGSAAQACETCGAAWVRVVERESITQRARGTEPSQSRAPGMPQQAGVYVSTVDRGFVPACRCETNTGAARSIVLDPFGGSGTVARVAERCQRDSMLIDLNPAYIDLQEERTNGVQVEMQLC